MLMRPFSGPRFFQAFSRATSPDSNVIELLRGPAGEEVEFATVMWFDSLESVEAFAGADYETAVVPPKARAVLKRFDARSRHYEVREERNAR
jgi:hypothetical protein